VITCKGAILAVMESRILSHSTAGPSNAREAFIGPVSFRPNVKLLRTVSKSRSVQLHVSARATAPAELNRNGMSLCGLPQLCNKATFSKSHAE